MNWKLLEVPQNSVLVETEKVTPNSSVMVVGKCFIPHSSLKLTRCNWTFLQTLQRGCNAFNAVGGQFNSQQIHLKLSKKQQRHSHFLTFQNFCPKPAEWELTSIHAKNEFCGGDGYLGKKKWRKIWPKNRLKWSKIVKIWPKNGLKWPKMA